MPIFKSHACVIVCVHQQMYSLTVQASFYGNTGECWTPNLGVVGLTLKHYDKFGTEQGIVTYCAP